LLSVVFSSVASLLCNCKNFLALDTVLVVITYYCLFCFCRCRRGEILRRSRVYRPRTRRGTASRSHGEMESRTRAVYGGGDQSGRRARVPSLIEPAAAGVAAVIR
jgi:hypothetical protein